LSLVSLQPASMCSLFMYISPCCVSCSHLVYPISHLYTSNIPINVWPIYKTLTLYDILMFEYWPWFLFFIVYSTFLDPALTLNLCSRFWIIPVTSRALALFLTSTLTSLWTMPVPDYFWTLRQLPNIPEILGVPRTHLKTRHKYK